MKPALKAALCSGLIFPGCGYFSIGHYRRGFLTLLVALSCLAIVVIDTYHKARTVADQLLENGQLSINMAQVQQLLAQTEDTFEPMLLSVSYGMLVSVWIFSVVDGYRLGRNQ